MTTAGIITVESSLLPRAIPAIFHAGYGQFLQAHDNMWLGEMRVEPAVAITVAEYVVANSGIPLTCSIISERDALTKVPRGQFHSRHAKALLRQAANLMRDADDQEIIVFDPYAEATQPAYAGRWASFNVEEVLDRRERPYAVEGEASGVDLSRDARDVISRLFKKREAIDFFSAHSAAFEAKRPFQLTRIVGNRSFESIPLPGVRSVRSNAGRGSGTASDEPPSRPTGETLDRGPRSDGDPDFDEERQINVWIEERRSQREQPLAEGERYTLSCNVAAPRDDAMTADGNLAVRPGDVPPGGLRTEWVLSSVGVELMAIAGSAVQIETGGDADAPSWSATFPLTIPEAGASETRSVYVRARAADDPRLVFAVFALRDNAPPRLYRRFSIRLPIEAPAETIPLDDDHVAVAARDINDRSELDWDAGASELAITPAEGIAVLHGVVAGEQVRTRVPWRIRSATSVAGLIESIRNAAERFRVQFEDVLNAVDRDELARRLEAFEPSFDVKAATDAASGEASTRLTTALASNEAYSLADAGYALYEAFFPPDSELRRHVDSLQPGDRLVISWPNDESPAAGIPWGLMYCAPPAKPVDPSAFLALRYRITYDAHPLRNAVRALGKPPETILGFGLYWGDAHEAIGEEAEWQRAHWASGPGHCVLPNGESPRASIVRWFESFDPATPIMYFYCRTGVVENETALLFSASDGVIRQADLGSAAFASRPLVFANACSTNAGDPYVANAIEQRFFRRGCRAYVGTECRVPIRLASRVAHVFLHLFERRADPRPVSAGEALFQTRLFLLRHFGNLGGIFYSVINLSDVCLATRDELTRAAS